MQLPRLTERSRRDNVIFSICIKSYSNEKDFVTFKRSINHVLLQTHKGITLFEFEIFSKNTKIKIKKNCFPLRFRPL